MVELEAMNTAEEDRLSIDKELKSLEPEELIKKFEALNVPNAKIKDFVNKEYLRVLQSKKQRIANKKLQADRRT